MKSIIKLLLLLILFVYSTNRTFSQEKKIKFSGTIENKDTSQAFTKVSMLCNIHDWVSNPKAADHISSDIDEKGNFKLSIPDIGRPYFVSFVVWNNERKVAFNFHAYVEPNDDVKVIFIHDEGLDSLIFHGIGAEKYSIMVELDKQGLEYFKELGSINLHNKNSKDLSTKYNEFILLLRKYKSKKSHILDAAKISPEMKIIINYNFPLSGGAINAGYDGDWNFRTTQLYNSNPELRSQIKSSYLKLMGDFFYPADTLIKYSPRYPKLILRQNIFKMRIEDNSEKVKLKSLYDKIKNNYKGSIRDYLLVSIFIDSKINSLIEPYPEVLKDSLLQDASELVSHYNVKKGLVRIIDLRNKTLGNKIIKAKFIRLDGQKFDLSSLKGKVFLIDVWYNGCGGCKEFHEHFEKEIYTKFKYNRDFVVLSVNVDSKDERWKSGIKATKGWAYTSVDYINVTTGNWFEGSFMKYYGVTGGPWIMLVDTDGTIVYQPQNGAINYEKLALEIESLLNKISKT